jgi:hypothetical protein
MVEGGYIGLAPNIKSLRTTAVKMKDHKEMELVMGFRKLADRKQRVVLENVFVEMKPPPIHT